MASRAFGWGMMGRTEEFDLPLGECCYLSIHRVRRKLDLTRPCDCSAIDVHLSEELQVEQWREHTGQIFAPQSQPTTQSVFEPYKQRVVRFPRACRYSIGGLELAISGMKCAATAIVFDARMLVLTDRRGEAPIRLRSQGFVRLRRGDGRSCGPMPARLEELAS